MDSFTFDTTNSQRSTFCMDWLVWAKFCRVEEKVDQCSYVSDSWYKQAIWSLFWCFTSRIGWFFNAIEESDGLYFEVAQSSWEKLSYSWLGVASGGVCIEDLEALFI